MWNMKRFVIPVIIGATEIVTEGLKKYLETRPGNHSTNSLKKKALPGKSHIKREEPQSETGSLSGGVHNWFKGRSTRGKETYDNR
jgi:hypothetical protein